MNGTIKKSTQKNVHHYLKVFIHFGFFFFILPVNTTVCESPQQINFNLKDFKELIAFGFDEFLFVPSPSCPSLFQPNVKAIPSFLFFFKIKITNNLKIKIKKKKKSKYFYKFKIKK